MTDYQKTRLFSAIKNDDLETVATVLHLHPALINCKLQTPQGMTTPLIQACCRGAFDTVKFLLKYGPDLSVTGHLNPARVIRSRGGYGTLDDVFPLLIATRGCQLSIVQILLKSGARVNQLNAAGQSALHVCSMNSDLNFYDTGIPLNDTCVVIMKTLISSGANINLQDSNGRTPLHYACEHGNGNLVKLLLGNGAQYALRDKNGLSALEMAAHDYYHIMSIMFEKCQFTIQETIEAYETVAFSYSCPSPYACLYKATSMRMEHNVPKMVLEPLECYGFGKEWEKLEDLEEFKDDSLPELRLQAMLARERIYKDKYIIQPFHWKMGRAVGEGDDSQLNALLKHHFKLFRQNDDYFYFTENFLVPYNGLFRSLAISDFSVLETETVTDIVQTLIECCEKIRETLEKVTKPSCSLELINEFEQILMTAGGLISKLLKRNRQMEDNKTEKMVAREMLQELLQRFPEVSAPAIEYRTTLAHILSSTGHKNVPYFTGLCSSLDYDLMEMLINIGFDIDAADSNGNTLLHVVISSVMEDMTISASHDCGYSGRSSRSVGTMSTNAVKTISLLLENGVYLHARNNAKKTVLDMLQDPKYVKCEGLQNVIKMVKQYDQFPTLKHIAAVKVQDLDLPYKTLLPRPLIRFISLH